MTDDARWLFPGVAKVVASNRYGLTMDLVGIAGIVAGEEANAGLDDQGEPTARDREALL